MIAHAGGWDEILLFMAVPTAWVLFLLARQKLIDRRAARERDDEQR